MRRKFFDHNDGFGHTTPTATEFLGQVHTEQAGGTEVFPQFPDVLATAGSLQKILWPIAVGDTAYAFADRTVLVGVVDQSGH
ncbi:hypothetical protein MSAS_15660 [Mycobacterium saskatchewanense]|nr:hypothetical protein MSAS_15660 [Mycobacterium saskatchewanense]